MENKQFNFEKIQKEEQEKKYFQELQIFLDDRYENGVVYPPREKLYSCFDLCDLNDIKVVILGQDPYHQKNQAMGMSFSVEKGIRIPPSLANIYKELKDDIGCPIPSHGDLSSWANQGVLLLNTVMSVEDSQANIHKAKGWEIFTDRVMRELNEYPLPIVFILWGKPAQTKAKVITNPKHVLLHSAHPSPLSSYRGFFGSKPFSKANAFLLQNGRTSIDWSIRS